MKRITLFLIFVLCLVSGIAFACQVPVFRYALERWTPDPYRVIVTPGSSRAFTLDEQAVVEFLQSRQAAPRAQSGVFANIAVEVAEETAADSPVAKMTLSYPQKIRGFETKPIREDSLTLENAKRLVDSPVRREIVERILQGESAIWVLVESGNAEVDSAAAELVMASAAEAKGSLEIPEGVMTPRQAESASTFSAVNADDVLRSEVPLKIDFSLLRMKRDDPAEAFFLTMLVSIEEDLGEYASEPMVFPVFGRGRLLEPLIGRGIRSENLLDYAAYICGACSCEVKDQNPGVDLLITADWETALHGSEVVIEKILPPLEGTGVFSAVAAPGSPAEAAGAEEAEEAEEAEVSPRDSPTASAPVADAASVGIPLTTILITVVVIILVVALGTILLTRKKLS